MGTDGGGGSSYSLRRFCLYSPAGIVFSLQVLLWLSEGQVSRLCVLHVFLEVHRNMEVTNTLGGAGGLPIESFPQKYTGGGLKLVPARQCVVLGRVLVFARGCLFQRPLYLFPGLEVVEMFFSNFM